MMILEDIIIQVKKPKELKNKLNYLKNNIDIVKKYQKKSEEIIFKNTWDYRLLEVKNKMQKILLQQI